MDSPLISVIIPVFNVEKYLDQCLTSVLSQTYTNLEIILVDDGSLDHSPELCDRYAILDTRIKIIHKKNGGQSSARNTGLNIATGEYISFVDSDDIIAPDMIEKLYTAFDGTENIFAVKCKMKRYKSGELYSAGFDRFMTECIVPSEKYLISLVTDYFSSSVCDMLFKASVFDLVRFEEEIKNEDFSFLYDIGGFIEEEHYGLKLIADELYYYRVTEGSTCNSLVSPFEIHCINNLWNLYEHAKSKGNSDVANCLYAKYAATLFSFTLKLFKNNEWKKQYYDKYHVMLEDLDMKKLYHYWGIRHLIGLAIMKWSPEFLYVNFFHSFITRHGYVPSCVKIR